MKTLDALKFRQLLRFQKELGIHTMDTLQGSMMEKFLKFLDTPTGRKWKQTPEAREVLD